MVKSISVDDYLKSLRKGEARKLKVVLNALESKLATGQLDPRTKTALAEKLSSLFKTSDPRNIPNAFRVLTFTPVEASILFSWNAPKLLEVFQSEPPRFMETKVEQDLADTLEKATGEIPGPKQVRCALDLQSGYFLRKVTPKFTGQAILLSSLLNTIARNQPHNTVFNYQGLDLKINSSKDLIDALLSSGHKIKLSQERMYADFLNLSVPGVSIRWPSWVDTGLDNKQGGTISVPIRHCQYTWSIQGPLVDTKIAFYLGTKGVAFIPEIYDSPDWHFKTIFQLYDSDSHQSEIYRAMELAMLFTHDITKTLGATSNDGYGFSGVCTDSAAFIEMGLTGNVTAYPLLRNTTLVSFPRESEVDIILNRIPLDTDLSASSEEAIPRILTTHPEENSWQRMGNLFDSQLEQDLQVLRDWKT